MTSVEQAHEQEEIPQKSFLIADCGSANTTVVLFDVAAGSYRLIARATVPTTAAAPWSDVFDGIQQAITRISETTGRPLLNKRGILMRPAQRDGSGVDHFAAVISAAPPLKTLLVGLFDDVSLASARRALSNIYLEEIDHFSLADTRTEREQIAAIAQKQPDLIFIAGGTDGGAEARLLKLVDTVSLGVSILAGVKRPQVIYAGNINLRERVREMLGEQANVQVANNVRPTLATEQPADAARIAGELYEDVKINTLPGIQDVEEWSSYPPIPTARAFANITGYFAALHKGRVLGLDLGSHSVTFVTADPQNVNVTIRSDLGMGQPIANILNKSEPAAIAHWLSSEISEADVRNYILNKSLHPRTVPTTEAELHLEQAVAREIIGCVVADATAPPPLPPFNLLLARGGVLTNTPRPEQAVLMLLDALQPTGIFSIALDKYGALPALGALAEHEPLAVVQALEAGVLVDLGWVIAPTGKGQPGQKVINVVVKPEEIGPYELDVEYGSIEVIALTPGQTTEITLQPMRRFDIGFGPGEGKKVALRGGAVGLVVDARGRPLDLPRDDAARRNRVRQWLWDMGG